MRVSCLVVVTLAALLSAACAVPLGPGYTVEKQQLDVRYVPSQPAHLEIRASYTLKNTGNSDLAFIETTLPDEKENGRSNLRVLVDNAEVVAQNAATDKAPRKGRVPFASPWPQKQKRTIVMEYQLSIPIGTSAPVEGFYLSTSDWYPVFQPPKGLFSKGGERPEKWDLLVRVPDRFLVHASGNPKGTKRRAGEAEHRFRQSPDDFDPFIVSGRYHEQQVTTHGITVRFWTSESAGFEKAKRLGTYLAETIQAYEQAFGRRRSRSQGVWMVEVTPESPSSYTFHLPDGVLFIRGFWMDEDAFLASANEMLSKGWFQVDSEESLIPLWPGLSWYAGFVAAEAHGKKLPQNVAGLLALHGLARKAVKNLTEDGTADAQLAKAWESQMRSTRSKLFFIALEQKCEKEGLRPALKRLAQSMNGETVGVADLRSALEAETGQDLAEFFRVWLNQPGIPDDFRKKYSTAEKGK